MLCTGLLIVKWMIGRLLPGLFRFDNGRLPIKSPQVVNQMKVTPKKEHSPLYLHVTVNNGYVKVYLILDSPIQVHKHPPRSKVIGTRFRSTHNFKIRFSHAPACSPKIHNPPLHKLHFFRFLFPNFENEELSLTPCNMICS